MENNQQQLPTRQIIHLILQLLALAALLSWCFHILAPFVTPVMWGGILAVVFYPLHKSISKKLGNRTTLVAVLLSIIMLAILLTPGIWLGFKTADELASLTDLYQQGKLTVPPPTEQVKSWPLVGREIYDLWKQASDGIETFIQQHPDTVKKAGGIALSAIASISSGVLLFAFSIIICGVFLSFSESTASFTSKLLQKISGSKHMDLASISAVTLRNVVKGILLVALIQAAMAAVGCIAAGIPAAALWSVICLMLAIAQVGILPVALPLVIYIWSTGSTLTATLFTIWMILMSVIDNVLKPLLLGKGAPAPMLVVFLGAIGGFIFSGFSGLFTGAVILSLGYQLFTIWIEEKDI